ncbi:MAG: CHRD domain-containing protein [Archangium sp.]
MRFCLALLAVSSLCACGPRELRVTMKPDNNSGQSGFAVIQELANELLITVETSIPDYQGPMGQLAHIHKGNCGEIGDIVVGLDRLKLLSNQERWGSTTRKKYAEITIKFDDFKKGDWAINVHDERDNPVYVSCGEVPKP